jgi:hypothetical protein
MPGRLAQADYSYLRSGFYLHQSPGGQVTLACFSATRHIRERIDRFIEAEAWHAVFIEPYVLLDLILEGLYMDVDHNVWNMNNVFGAEEHVRSHMPSTLV